MVTTYEEIEDEVALGGWTPSNPQVATRRQVKNDYLAGREATNTRKARPVVKDTIVRAKDTRSYDETAQPEHRKAKKTSRAQGQMMDTPEIARKKALATDLARLNRKKHPKKADVTNQENISKQQGVLMKMIDKGATDATISKQIDLIEALTNRTTMRARDYQVIIESDQDSSSGYESSAKSNKPSSRKSPIMKRRKKNLQEEEFNLRTAFPAAQPRAQLPRNLRQDRGISIEKIIEASQAVHPSHDPMQTNELDKHNRHINKTNGVKKSFQPPKRTIEARVGLFATPSPPPEADGQSLNQENLRLHGGDVVMASIENWQEYLPHGDLPQDGSSPATEWKV